MEPLPRTYKRCPICTNDYEVEALCFKDDPVEEICNGCWRSREGIGYPEKVSPDLEIDVRDGVGTSDRVGR